jgi:uncharacterized repeat protein (TIGR03803 family)
VTLDKAGNLYGTTSYGGSYVGTNCSGTGCGTVYELVASSGGYTEKVLYRFKGAGDGMNPFGSVTFDSSGNLYGSTSDGGFGGAGVAFKLTQANGTWSYAPLYSFSGVSGNFCGPYGNLAFDVAGNLYGTTYCSGGYGNVFKLTPAGAYTSLHYFTDGSDGANPISNVTFDASGNLYGTASLGANTTCVGYGVVGCGVVWKITP